MSHSCIQVYLHIIFSTKGRMPLIPQNMENRLYGYLMGIASENQSPILRINGVADHIHLLLKQHPSNALSNLIRELKSYSTGWIKKQGVKEFGWQEGYGGFSCSVTHLDALKSYIDNQKIHHQKATFEQEIEIINRLWNVEWMVDKDYVT